MPNHEPEFYDRWGDLLVQYPWDKPVWMRAMSAWCPDCNERVQLDHSPQSRNLKGA
jgi:hypothetical protein